MFEFLIIIFTCIIFFIAGGVYIQAKETKYGKKAKYNCENCLALGCQYKFCEMKRKERKGE